MTFSGTSDRIIPKEQTEALDRELKENNVPHELYLLPGTDHAFDILSGNLSTQFAFEKIKAFLEKYN
ncbi:alpha/beta hydrolase family protein [Lysinibacillus sp. NPDC097214]|uniref:alpha/beta hydrolase family protein n=1 Tax=Lysinibacillus sp. NPDC097214 TaxID=3390584 RepID=UPI003D05EB31